MSAVTERVLRLNERLASEPKNAELYVERGYAWLDTGERARALSDFERAIALDPFCVGGLAARANLRLGDGDFDGSIDDCTRALGIEADNVAVLCTRAACYLQKKEPERALEGFDRVLQLAPGERGALYWRGVAKEALGDLDGAQRDYAQSDALKPPLEPLKWLGKR